MNICRGSASASSTDGRSSNPESLSGNGDLVDVSRLPKRLTPYALSG